MRTNQLPRKHRATVVVPPGERPAATRAHQAASSSDLPIAAVLGILVAVYFALRG